MSTNLLRFALLCGALVAPASFAQFSSPVRDVENPDRYAVVAICELNVQVFGNGGLCSSPFNSPDGKTVILTTLNVRCEINQDSLVPRLGKVALLRTADGAKLLAPPVGQFVTISPEYGEQGLVVTGLRIPLPPTGSGPWPLKARADVSFLKAGNGTMTCTAIAHGHYLP